jgi:hypothetical protein
MLRGLRDSWPKEHATNRALDARFRIRPPTDSGSATWVAEFSVQPFADPPRDLPGPHLRGR